MTILELKKYIFQKGKIEFILNEIGCGYIVYHPNKEYYSCSNCNGDNKAANKMTIDQAIRILDPATQRLRSRKSELQSLLIMTKIDTMPQLLK